jgi:hypothetical protein
MDVTSAKRPRPKLYELACCAWLVCTITAASAQAEDGVPAGEPAPASPSTPNLVKQANAPVSSILQLRFQDDFAPESEGGDGDGNLFSIAITMPLPEYRLLPFPQLSLLTIPAAVTPPGESTDFGDIRLVDIAVFQPHDSFLWGVGPTLVFPSAGDDRTGQGKWQAGPVMAAAFSPARWLVGFIARNPISFAGDDDRADVNVLLLQPFVTYQLGGGWFLRSQPQMIFNWERDRQMIPIDLGFGRVFELGSQRVNVFVEPYWNAAGDEPAPEYGVIFGMGLLYPNFWGS